MMLRTALAVCACLVLSLPVSALTLEELNAPPPADPFWDALTVAASTEEILALALSNDDCQLGYSDEELGKMLYFVDMMGGLSRVGNGPVPGELDIGVQETLWQARWAAASRVVRLHYCQPMHDLTERVR